MVSRTRLKVFVIRTLPVLFKYVMTYAKHTALPAAADKSTEDHTNSNVTSPSTGSSLSVSSVPGTCSPTPKSQPVSL